MRFINVTGTKGSLGECSSLMIVKQLAVGPMANFVYLVADPETKEALVVDSGWETDPVVAARKEIGAKVKLVVATHRHFDHATTLRALAEELGAKVAAHVDSPVDHDVGLRDGQVLRLGRRALKVLHTPGHTEDSICLYGEGCLFSGDTLFIGTVGKFEKGDTHEMFKSLYEVIMKLPDPTVVYPGHDYGEAPFRRLKEEKNTNPFLQAPDVRSFLSIFS